MNASGFSTPASSSVLADSGETAPAAASLYRICLFRIRNTGGISLLLPASYSACISSPCLQGITVCCRNTDSASRDIPAYFRPAGKIRPVRIDRCAVFDQFPNGLLSLPWPVRIRYIRPFPDDKTRQTGRREHIRIFSAHTLPPSSGFLLSAHPGIHRSSV